MKRIATLLIVATALLGGSPAVADWPSLDNVFYAQAFGSGSAGIQAAVDAATSGGTVRIPAGITQVDFSEASGGATVSMTIDAAANTITRATGSFTGVEVGDLIVFCGTACSGTTSYDPWTNAVNNLARRVTAVAAGVVTVTDTSNILVNETATVDFYAGKPLVIINKPLTIEGYGGGHIDAADAVPSPGSTLVVSNAGMGTVFWIQSSGVRIRHLNIRLQQDTARHKYTSAIMCGWTGYYNDISISDVGIDGNGIGRGIGVYSRGCLKSGIRDSDFYRLGTAGAGGGVVLTSAENSASNGSNAWVLGPNLQIGTSDGVVLERQAYVTGDAVADLSIVGARMEGGKFGVHVNTPGDTIVSIHGSHLEQSQASCRDVQIVGNGAVVHSFGNFYASACASHVDRDTANFYRSEDTFIGDQFVNTATNDFDYVANGVARVVGDSPAGYTSMTGGGTILRGWASASTVATASASPITNTTTETAFSTCAYTVPADSSYIGTTYRITAGGIISTDAVTPQIAIRARWGAVNTNPLLLDLGPTTLALGGATSDGFTVSGLVTIRTIGATGTAVGTGTASIVAVAANGDSDVIADNQASTTTIDTTAATALTLFADWTTQDTDNTITLETCLIERIQ
jgi:hypothetical protein